MSKDILNTIRKTTISGSTPPEPLDGYFLYWGASPKNVGFSENDIKGLGFSEKRIDRFKTISGVQVTDEYLVIAIPQIFGSEGKFLYSSFNYDLEAVTTLPVKDELEHTYPIDVFVFKYKYSVEINNLEIL